MKLLSTGKVCLEIRRLETEADYLEYQLRQLRGAALGDLKTRMDVEPIRETSQSPYAVLRLRVIGEDLRPAHRILYPQDQFRLSEQALSIAGVLGIGCLWIDNGKRVSGKYRLSQRRYDTLDWIELMAHLKEHYDQRAFPLGKSGLYLMSRPTEDDPEGAEVITGLQLQTPERDRVPRVFTKARPLAPKCMRRAFASTRGISQVRETQEPPETKLGEESPVPA
jgi:hypothetical protein